MRLFVSIILIVLIIGQYMYAQRYQYTSYRTIDFSHLLSNAQNPRFRETLQQLINECNQENRITSLNSLATLLLTFGQHQEAAALFQLILQEDSRSYSAQVGFAIALDQLGYLEKSIAAYQEAATYSHNADENTECKQRAGELLLRLGKIDEAQALFSYLQYAPALVDLCRIAVYRNDQATAHKLFQVLHRSDPEHKSLEIYQLNALGQRHFGNRFAEINPTRDRSLIYSRNMPLEYQKHVSSMIFDFTPGEIYAPYISGLPYVENPAFKPTDEMLFAASTNKQSVSRGEQLFHGQNCSVCHGQAGIGITGPNLRDDFWIIQATPTQIFFTLQDGRANNTMPGYKHLLDSEQLTDLSAYLIHLNRSAVKDSSGKAPQGQPQRLIPVNQ